MEIKIATHVSQDYNRVFEGFTEDLFQNLAPSIIPTKLLRFDGSKKGDEVHLMIGPGKLAQRWEALVVEDGKDQNKIYFIDVGQRLPFPLKEWKHRHLIQNNPEGGTIIVDHITFKTVHPLLAPLFYPFFWWMFWIRKPVYRKFFS